MWMCLQAEKGIDTLGGSNHLIEVDRDDEGQFYVVVYSGSRHLEVAKYYQKKGYKTLNRTDDGPRQQLMADLKAAGRQRELKRLKNLRCTAIP